MNMEANEMERAIARQKSYVGAAILVFILYCIFYIPGLIANILYISAAGKTAKAAGKSCRQKPYWIWLPDIYVYFGVIAAYSYNYRSYIGGNHWGLII